MLNIQTTSESALCCNDGARLSSQSKKRDFQSHGPKTKHDEILKIIGIASHDIRGGLVSSAAALKLLQKGFYGKIDQTVSRELEKLYNKIRGLMGVVEDSFSRSICLEGQWQDLHERLDLKEDILDRVLEEIEEEVQNNEIIVFDAFRTICKSERTTKGNRFLLKAVFRNLIQNAIKYGEKGSRIAIGIRNRSHSFLINIYNSGTPVPRQYRDGLFCKEERGIRDHTKNPEGMGFGLYYVKKIVENHGGDIWYEAKERGSNFVFTLPRQQS